MRLFEFLWQYRRTPVFADRLYNVVWGNVPDPPSEHIVAVRVCHIRKALKNTAWQIVSNRGAGREDKVYCLLPEWAEQLPWMLGSIDAEELAEISGNVGYPPALLRQRPLTSQHTEQG